MISPNLEINRASLHLSDPEVLLSTLRELRRDVEEEGNEIFNQWQAHTHRSEFLSSALNLAHYADKIYALCN